MFFISKMESEHFSGFLLSVELILPNCYGNLNKFLNCCLKFSRMHNNGFVFHAGLTCSLGTFSLLKEMFELLLKIFHRIYTTVALSNAFSSFRILILICIVALRLDFQVSHGRILFSRTALDILFCTLRVIPIMIELTCNRHSHDE